MGTSVPAPRMVRLVGTTFCVPPPLPIMVEMPMGKVSPEAIDTSAVAFTLMVAACDEADSCASPWVMVFHGQVGLPVMPAVSAPAAGST